MRGDIAIAMRALGLPHKKEHFGQRGSALFIHLYIVAAAGQDPGRAENKAIRIILSLYFETDFDKKFCRFLQNRCLVTTSPALCGKRSMTTQDFFDILYWFEEERNTTVNGLYYPKITFFDKKNLIIIFSIPINLFSSKPFLFSNSLVAR